MSKTIKIDEQVYDALNQLRLRDETFSDVVAKAVKATVAVAAIQADLHDPDLVNRMLAASTASTG